MSFTSGASVHFIGIGGAGMSAIAKVLLERGVRVTGSDLKRSRAATMLEAMGAEIREGHDPSVLAPGRVVVVSSAIPAGDPELVRARELGIEIMSRGEALAALLDGHRAVVVAGTHGKTTTTSMTATVLGSAGLDPTYLIGGGLNDAGTNARDGSSDVAVAESDESDASFLLLAPYVAVITNIELDHVDRWRSLDELREAFSEFMRKVHPDGTIVAPADDPVIVDMARSAERRVVTFGDDGDVTAHDVVLETGSARFSLSIGGPSAEVNVRVPGRHNVTNALAAAAACRSLGVDLGAIAEGLSAYRGVERRFQLRGRVSGVTVIDDYAHHPTEVAATLAAVRPGPWDRVVAVFQPHRYSRTRALAGSFGASFSGADRIVVTDVYGAGEEPMPGVTGKVIADQIAARLHGRPIAYLPHRSELLDYLETTSRSGDLVLTLGAGDITTVGEELLGRLGTAS